MKTKQDWLKLLDAVGSGGGTAEVRYWRSAHAAVLTADTRALVESLCRLWSIAEACSVRERLITSALADAIGPLADADKPSAANDEARHADARASYAMRLRGTAHSYYALAEKLPIDDDPAATIQYQEYKLRQEELIAQALFLESGANA